MERGRAARPTFGPGHLEQADYAMNKPMNKSDALCACIGLSHQDALSQLAQMPGQDFDAFLARTGAGKDCTACMLDLEHFFINAPRTEKGTGFPAGHPEAKRIGVPRWRWYRLLDRVFPKFPVKTSNVMPVLLAPEVEQYLVLSNYPMLYEKAEELSDFRLKYDLRDASGALRYSGTAELPVGDRLRINVTCLLPSAEDVSVGSLHIRMRARSSGVGGTTRPQTEILTPTAATSLHFQAPQPLNARTLATYYRPGEDRTFFSLVNGVRKPAMATFEIFRPGASDCLLKQTIRLSAFESRLVEVSFPDDIGVVHGDQIISRFTGAGFVSLHVICTDPALSRISIDHI